MKVVIVYLAGVVFGSVGGSLPSPTSYLGKAEIIKNMFQWKFSIKRHLKVENTLSTNLKKKEFGLTRNSEEEKYFLAFLDELDHLEAKININF